LKAERTESTAPTGNLMNRLKTLKTKRTETPKTAQKKLLTGEPATVEKFWFLEKRFELECL